MSELSNLQLFARVVEEGSFSAAARYLGVTPSSVSRQISQLEGDLSARLFHRTTRKQSLTEAGEIYYRHARGIVADLEEARLAVSRLSDAPSGNLHLTAEADFAVAILGPLLPEFLERYPAVQLRLSLSSGIVDLVDSGIDLALRIGHLDDSTLIARKIAESRSVICASPAYLAIRGAPGHPSELVKHSCLSFRTSSGKTLWKFELPEGSLEVPISGSLKANSLVLLRDSALAALGIIMIPSWMVRDELKGGRLVPLLSGFPRASANAPINAIYAHRRHLAPKVRAFVDFLAERIEAL